MLGYLFLLFTVIPVLELIVIIKVGANIGAVNTIVLLIGIGMLGAYLARLQGFHILRNIQENLGRGILPTEAMLDGFLIFCGGVLLLTPGFLTDIIGILFLLPPVRAILKPFCKVQMRDMAKRGEIISFGSGPTRRKRGYENYEDADFS